MQRLDEWGSWAGCAALCRAIIGAANENAPLRRNCYGVCRILEFPQSRVIDAGFRFG